MRRFPAGYEFPSKLYCPNNAIAAFLPVMGTSVLCFAEVGTASIPESRLPSDLGYRLLQTERESKISYDP